MTEAKDQKGQVKEGYGKLREGASHAKDSVLNLARRVFTRKRKNEDEVKAESEIEIDLSKPLDIESVNMGPKDLLEIVKNLPEILAAFGVRKPEAATVVLLAIYYGVVAISKTSEYYDEWNPDTVLTFATVTMAALGTLQRFHREQDSDEDASDEEKNMKQKIWSWIIQVVPYALKIGTPLSREPFYRFYDFFTGSGANVEVAALLAWVCSVGAVVGAVGVNHLRVKRSKAKKAEVRNQRALEKNRAEAAAAAKVLEENEAELALLNHPQRNVGEEDPFDQMGNFDLPQQVPGENEEDGLVG